MFDSILLYAGAAALLLVPFWKRHRRSLLAFGSAAIATALLWPARTRHVATRTTQLDRAMPAWQFREVHSIDIHAPPERVYAAMRGVTANEILFFRTLTAIRRLGRRQRESILNAPATEPLLDVATRNGFDVVADDPPQEYVVETVIARPRACIAAMNFRITPEGLERSVLTTETRVYAATPAAARRFAVYWRVIHPGSDIIRRMWLRAVRLRAEGGRMVR
jgi:hypothetical protein